MVILIDSLIKHHDHKRVLLYKNDKDAGACSPSVDFVTRAFLCDLAMLVLKALRLPEFEKMNSMW